MMKRFRSVYFRLLSVAGGLIGAGFLCCGAWGQGVGAGGRGAGAEGAGGLEFGVGKFGGIGELPAGRFRSELEGLAGSGAQERAVGWLRSFHFTGQDLEHLHADGSGGIFYACEGLAGGAGVVPGADPGAAVGVGAGESAGAAGAAVPGVAGATVAVSPFPAGLVFHSKAGAANVLYINFCGETVSGTSWNTEISRTAIPAVAFDTDSDPANFSESEQVAIKRIWERMAEDYAPFNIDVTTERPAVFTTRTAMALITRTTDANGQPNPYSTAGGVAYVNVFGSSTYGNYRPAWIYQDNLANGESYIAEAASHEVGHNLGLSHDGVAGGSDYYGGHGSGDISWGPLMGTGYNRNVSQWSKGEYYQASNTQDDLATMGGKVGYRTDDHGGTAASATALVITGGTNIVATTPEDDPGGGSLANKGVLERNTDVDVFSFVTGSGPVRLAVNPWIMASGTRGGNADISIELYDEGGGLVASSNPGAQTTALIETNLAEGRYFLHVRGSGAGDPMSSTPTGYTVYGSIGQYFISGFITEAPGYAVRPAAELAAGDLVQPGQASKTFTVTYSDNVGVDVSSIDSADVLVSGPNGYAQLAQLVSLDAQTDGSPRTATYSVVPMGGGVWLPAQNGTYSVWMQTNEVADTEGAWVAAGLLGQFTVSVPATIYAASMDADPGWTLDPEWAYGTPAYGAGGPGAGFTGGKIIGYNLSGDYPNNLATKYATTPAINCTGYSSLALSFKRWLRTRQNDAVAVQVSTNGVSWADVWSTTSAVSDSAWQSVQYSLPEWAAGSAKVQLRWSIASNQSQTDIGWNIDDVALLGDGTVDTAAPGAVLSVAGLVVGGSPSHSCTVTYSDATAVRLSSLDSTDLVVTGPNGYSNAVEFGGADLPADGSPITAIYSVMAPGGEWGAEDNGTYTITLVENAVLDTLGNGTARAVLGSFDVTITAATAGFLDISPGDGLSASGVAGGPFAPSSITYCLTNSGGSAFNWSATVSQDWVSVSSTGGALAAGAATNVVVSINSGANALDSGNYTNGVTFSNADAPAQSASRGVELAVRSVPIVLSGVWSEPGEFRIVLSGQGLREYVIERSTDAVNWAAVATNTTSSEGTFVYSEATSGEGGGRLYRARMVGR